MKKIKQIAGAIIFTAACLSFTQTATAKNNDDDGGRRGRHFDGVRYYSQRQYYSRPFYNHSYYSYPIFPRVYHRPSFYNQGSFYNPGVFVHFGPAFGFRVNVLPFGYAPYFFGGIPYYYSSGVYYRRYNNDYEVVAPPLGASVNSIPSNAKVTIIDGQKYYQLGGTFYQEEITPNNTLQYIVVGTDGVINTMHKQLQQQAVNNGQNNSRPNMGDVVSQLPENCSTVIQNQSKYFLSPSGVYYQELIEGNELHYKVTGYQDK